MDAAGLNVTAYAVRSDRGDIWLTLINKDATRDAPVRAACPGIVSADVLRLTAPSLASKDGVQLGGSQVTIFGKWTPRAPERIRVTGGELEISLQAASAALLRLR